MHGHLGRLRDCQPLTNSRIILIIERNYGGAVRFFFLLIIEMQALRVT